jgi:hypothetical protein
MGCGNVTGASLFTSEPEVKKLALLREVVPKAPLIAMLVNPTNPPWHGAHRYRSRVSVARQLRASFSPKANDWSGRAEN